MDWPQQALVMSAKIPVNYVKCEHNRSSEQLAHHSKVTLTEFVKRGIVLLISIRRMEYPEFQTGIFGRMESAPYLPDMRCFRMNYLTCVHILEVNMMLNPIQAFKCITDEVCTVAKKLQQNYLPLKRSGHLRRFTNGSDKGTCP